MTSTNSPIRGDWGDFVKITTRAASPKNSLMDAIGQYMERMVKTRLAGDKYDFVPLKKYTIKNRRGGKKKGNQKAVPLVDTADMKNSISYFAGSRDVYIGVKSSVRYAKFHQYGTKNIPQRPFLVVWEEDLVIIGKLIEQYLIEGGKRFWKF